MKPEYILYNLENDFNLELFLRAAGKDGFSLEGKLIFSPNPAIPKKSCICLTKGTPYAQGFIYDRELYVIPNRNGEFPELKEFADSFTLGD